MTVRETIKALGGLTAAARKIGVPVTTVQWWRDQNRIPHWREHQLHAACEADGVEPPQAEVEKSANVAPLRREAN